MASKTEIANRGLSKLGHGRVSNIETDNTKAAKVMNEMWDIVRNSLLTSYPWNFAIVRSSLAKDAEAPAWGYANQYTPPSDFLALLEIKNDPDYRVEADSVNGLKIVTDAGAPLKIRYIRLVENTGEYDPLFADALAAKLAVEACEILTQSNKKKEILIQEYRAALDAAYKSDAIQDPSQNLRDDEWLVARNSSVYYNDIDYNS